MSYNGSSREEVGVVAAFLEVHDNIQQRDLVSSSFCVQSLKVLCQNELVVFPANRGNTFTTPLIFLRNKRISPLTDSLLHGAELYSDNELSLRGHVFEHISLQPPEHVWAQHVMQLLDLVLLGDVSKLFQENLQVAAGKEATYRRVVDDI